MVLYLAEDEVKDIRSRVCSIHWRRPAIMEQKIVSKLLV
jgi:hypothetical protein